MPSAGFVHLTLHSEYSLTDSVLRVGQVVDAVRAAGMPAVAVTDAGNLFALVKFYKAAQAAGIKPIVGADVTLWEPGEPTASRLVLLCQNHAGYVNLCRLLSRAYVEGQRAGRPGLQRDWLAGHVDGLIALSGGVGGDVGAALLAGANERAARLLADWQALFPDRYYLELTRTGRPGEEAYIAAAVELALAAGVPVVATNDVRFVSADDFEAHEARVCIAEGRVLNDPRRPHPYSEQQYLRTAQEMAVLFADLPEALENTVAIAQRCNLELTLGRPMLPAFPVPAGRTPEAHLAAQAEAGLRQLLARGAPADEAPYWQRLQIELDVINRMGFPGYFLVVADFIAWARDNGVPVGPGRGSGAGSLVAWALGITRLDPLANDLLFERFLNPERVSLPDFDVDFCMDGRDRVIDYVAERYGRERVSQIITYGSMAAKAVVRDVGRVLGLPYGFVDSIAKLIPFELGITLDKALADEAALRARYEEEDEVRTLIDLAKSLEGLARNAGKHAGGVVIAPGPLTDFVPLFCEAGGGSPVTQYDKDDVEAIGLVKFDFLGLRTLTIIDWALKTLARRDAAFAEFDIDRLPLDDEAAYALLRRCETTAVFQLESRGMRDLIRRLQPDCFEDVVALVALYRPGPLQSGMVDDFIDRKHGRAQPDYLEPRLEPVLRATYGIILYQEQVMQIAQVLAGYSLGQADLLRRAMGKKKPEEMAKQRNGFVEGAVANGVSAERAGEIFDLIEKFAGYGFNKSHSAAYALLSYQTAWLKAHHPAAFMAAVLSADMDHTDKVVTLIDECRRMELTVLAPDVNRGQHAFTVTDDGAILYGLGALKGVGEAAIEAIVEARATGGPFTDLFDFCRRIDPRRVAKRTTEALIRAGAFDALNDHRAALLASLAQAYTLAEQESRAADAGQNDMFGAAFAPADASQPAVVLADCPRWSEAERLAAERETLGLWLSGHPIGAYEAELERLVDCRLADVQRFEGRTARVAGLVVASRTLSKGRRMTFVTLDDRTARLEVTLFEEQLAGAADLLARDRLLVVEGGVSVDEFNGGYRIRAEKALALPAARAGRGARLYCRLGGPQAARSLPAQLAETLGAFSGTCPVLLDVRGTQARGLLRPGPRFNVRAEDVLLERLRRLPGVEVAEFHYEPLPDTRGSVVPMPPVPRAERLAGSAID
ncbi:DNA polymerase III subunit alpha [Immundisolibacter sp.]|uniref:DNA polymerase III subunit alpha n=1 Tax=Immundisolibacter sp. TaxID=1934948 RepID=UPI003F839A92